MKDNIIVKISCQIALTQEQPKQLPHIIQLENFQRYNMQVANDEIAAPQQCNRYYTIKALAVILGLNCSNDVEFLVKKLGLKAPKYGRWSDSNKLPDATNQFHYNQTALARLVTYIELTKVKVA